MTLRAAVARTLAPNAAPEPGDVAALMASYDPNRATPLDALPAAPSVLQENPSSTSVAVVDAFGNAVSCVFTMNSLFGNGRVAPGTGIVLASRPGGERGDGMSLLPTVMANENSRDVIFVGAVSGGIVAAPVLATVAGFCHARRICLSLMRLPSHGCLIPACSRCCRCRAGGAGRDSRIIERS